MIFYTTETERSIVKEFVNGDIIIQIQNLWQDKWITTVQSDIKIDTDFQSITQLDIDKRVCSAWLNYKNLKSNLV